VIEQAVLKRQCDGELKPYAEGGPVAPRTADAGPSGTPAAVPDTDPAGSVVLDYCSAVRGILNDDQGGPLNPPGVRMAEALGEVRESIRRNVEEQKGGSRRSNSADWPAASTEVSMPPGPNKRRSEPTSRTSRRSPRPSNLEGGVGQSGGRRSQD
jgi:hypothetical protein